MIARCAFSSAAPRPTVTSPTRAARASFGRRWARGRASRLRRLRGPRQRCGVPALPAGDRRAGDRCADEAFRIGSSRCRRTNAARSLLIPVRDAGRAREAGRAADEATAWRPDLSCTRQRTSLRLRSRPCSGCRRRSTASVVCCRCLPRTRSAADRRVLGAPRPRAGALSGRTAARTSTSARRRSRRVAARGHTQLLLRPASLGRGGCAWQARLGGNGQSFT